MTRKPGARKPVKTIGVPEPTPADEGFDVIERLIATARQRAFQAVNTTLIDLYWQIGEHISRKVASAEWVDAVVKRLAAHIARPPAWRASYEFAFSSINKSRSG